MDNQALLSNQYIIVRSKISDDYRMFRLDEAGVSGANTNQICAPNMVEITLNPSATFDRDWRIAQVGCYLVCWGKAVNRVVTLDNGDNQDVVEYPFKVLQFDPNSDDPLNAQPIQQGFWDKEKFWDHRAYYSQDKNEDEFIDLVPMGSFLLNTLFSQGRGTFRLFNFDPLQTGQKTPDPLASYFGLGQGAFPTIKKGHQLYAFGNYVLERLPNSTSYRSWSFDPQQLSPLPLPAISQGQWDYIDSKDILVPMGDKVLRWNADSNRYSIHNVGKQYKHFIDSYWNSADLPQGVDANSELIGIQSKIPVNEDQAKQVGNIDYMRSKIKHVVYYMVESRSFDNVLGWLYQNDTEQCHYVGSEEAFEGASTEYSNRFNGDTVYVSKFNHGELSETVDLMALNQDPFHNTMDSLQQMYFQIDDYWQGKAPDMQGFILNSANPQVMQTFTPQQLPIINGLAKSFAVSDQWFSSVPGGTDVNRGFSVTGSAYNKLGTWEGGDIYKYFPYSPHRQSLWKVLWSQGIKEWKIYYSMEWDEAVFSYQLYLQGQIPSVDAAPDDYIQPMDKFFQDAKNGTLPRFSYLEPFWYKKDGTTSYHPGCDLVLAEVALNEIYQALKQSKKWNETLLVITFDKNNGIYDHVSPPHATKPWPHDFNNGFSYDLMGPRVPMVMVSPWIKERTIFRSAGEIPFDSTSFAATLLNWFGIPKSQWALGDRIECAPTFENIFKAEEARSDAPDLQIPYDKTYPKGCGKTIYSDKQ